jgi:hypothetical protein
LNITRRTISIIHVASGKEESSAYRMLVKKPEGKRPLGRSWRRREGNINMDFQEIRWCAWTALI